MSASGGNIFLVGFSGSGKTTIGKGLATHLRMKFFDTDQIIASREGKSIGCIFTEDGEAYFRQLEREVTLELVTGGGRKVIALGGGAYERRAVRQLARHSGLVIYLSCSQKVLYQRLRGKSDRPLLNGGYASGVQSSKDLKLRISMLLKRRIRHYKEADLTVSTSDGDSSDAVKRIVKRLSTLNG